MALIGWGKPTIEISKLDAEGAPTTWEKIRTPVQDTTQLVTTKGEKLEAPIEGGGFEDVKYKRNTYALEFELYASKGTEKPIVDDDGVVNDQYAVRVTPEDPTVEGVIIDRSTVSVEDTWAANIGGKWKYTFDVLVPMDGSKQIKWDVIEPEEVVPEEG